MKRFLVIGAILATAYYFYERSGEPVGVYAADGTPVTILFTTDQCGRACEDMRRFLKTRTRFEEYDAFDSGYGRELYESYGGTGYLPYIVMGKQRVIGYDRGGVISAIAAEYGPSKVKEKEAKALGRHFKRNGDPIVVMYATAWCGYCNKARQYFRENRIPFVEFDIEKDHAARRDYHALLGSGTPLLYQGYTRVNGFDVRRIEREFDL